MYDIAFSPDGKALAETGSGGDTRLWDVQTGALLKTFGGAGNRYAAAFSPDSKLLASAGEEKAIQVWDVKTGKVVQTFSAEGAAPIRSLAFSPDGKSLAAADTDYSGRIYFLAAPPE